MAWTHAAAAASPPDTSPDLVMRIQAEYREMPGLSITLRQAERLFGAGGPRCEAALAVLVGRGILRATAKGRYVRR